MAVATNTRIAITGVTGTLGRNVLAGFAASPENQVLALVRSTSQTPAARENLNFSRVNFFDAADVSRTLEEFKPTSVIHCAATGMQVPHPGWDELIRFNVDVSVALCEATGRVPGCHFVYVSTGLAYRDLGRRLKEEDPLDTLHPYGASKAAADILLRAKAAAAGVPVTVVRPFSFSGPGDVGSRLIPSLLRAAEQNQPLRLSPGDQVRDHCAVQDIAAGIALASAHKPNLERGPNIFNLGSGDTLSLRQLIQGLVDELGLKVKLDFGARGYAQFEPKYLVADIALAQKQLGWQPRRNFAHAVWQLARESFPGLKINEPREERN